jgi:hypothetical protein
MHMMVGMQTGGGRCCSATFQHPTFRALQDVRYQCNHCHQSNPLSSSIAQSNTRGSWEIGVSLRVLHSSGASTPIRKVSQYQKELRPAPHVCACNIFTECSGKEDRAHWRRPPSLQPDQTCDSASAARSAALMTRLRSKGVLLSTRYNPCDRD